MNIEQIKTDLAAGVIVSPATWRKLVAAAMIQQHALRDISYDNMELCQAKERAREVIETVEEL